MENSNSKKSAESVEINEFGNQVELIQVKDEKEMYYHLPINITVKLFEFLKKANRDAIINLIPQKGGNERPVRVEECSLISW